MPSPITPSPGGPITQLPYDIIQEIFAHCLPRYPLHRRQPSTTTAPILLCHICSSWRTLALASPTLWTHLSYCLTIADSEEHARNSSGSASWRFQFTEPDLEFIWWWRANQGHIAPFLSLEIEKYQHTSINQKVTGPSLALLLEYLPSAQYLELDIFYWGWIHNKLQAGYPIVFPNLHTVLIEPTWAGNNPFYQLLALLPAHALPALRRLAISEITSPNDFPVPHHWSTLTHVSLHISIPLDFWPSLIRAVPHLRWGYFDIATNTMPSGTNTTHSPPPPQCTLLELTTLTISIRGRLERDLVFPLSLLFTNLCLPSLCTLSLSAPGARAWEDRGALHELYTVLRSTPAITKLALEDKTLSLDAHTPATILPAIPDAGPIWAHAPELAHLQLALPAGIPRNKAQREESLAVLVHHIFSADNTWLDLQNPASSIRAVTISNNGAFQSISNLAMSGIREDAGKAPEVVFEITSESAGQVAADVRKEWGVRI